MVKKEFYFSKWGYTKKDFQKWGRKGGLVFKYASSLSKEEDAESKTNPYQKKF